MDFSIFRIILLLFTSITADGALGEANTTERLKCINGNVCSRPELRSLKFLLLGDTGGFPIHPYITYAQKKVASTMAKIGYEKNTEFLISAGDNIYYTGVKDENDPRFKRTFEDVYEGAALEKPWYFVAGNHDHFGNVSAQIAYTNKSKRWTFPSLYYKLSYEFGPKKTLVEFLMIDTIVLCGNTRDIESAGFFKMLFADVTTDPNNPKNPAAAKQLLHWIEQQLNQSRANYVFVVGHYPVYSIASHGPSTCLIQNLKPLLEKYNISAYFAGHDHTLQHIVTKSNLGEHSNQLSVIHYIVSGASSRSETSTRNEDKIPYGSLRFHYPYGFNPLSQLGFSNGGFVFVELQENSGIFKFYDGTGNLKYEFSLEPHRFSHLSHQPALASNNLSSFSFPKISDSEIVSLKSINS